MFSWMSLSNKIHSFYVCIAAKQSIETQNNPPRRKESSHTAPSNAAFPIAQNSQHTTLHLHLRPSTHPQFAAGTFTRRIVYHPFVKYFAAQCTPFGPSTLTSHAPFPPTIIHPPAEPHVSKTTPATRLISSLENVSSVICNDRYGARKMVQPLCLQAVWSSHVSG